MGLISQCDCEALADLAATISALQDERGDGHGFGLPIARELAELYVGNPTLGDVPGGGLLASVSLPIGR